MKKLLFVLILGLSFACFAEPTLQIAATTDYISRGVTNSNNGPAIQGEAEYIMPIGALIGLWTSTLGDNTGGQELDFYAGYEKEIIPDFTIGAKAISYRYLKNSSQNSWEGNLYFSYRMFSLNIYYAPEVPVANDTRTYKNWYANFSSNMEIMKDISIGGAVGYSYFNDKVLADRKNYFDGTISLIKSIQNTTISMNFSETNRKNNAGEKQKDQSIYFTGSISL